MRLIWYFIFYFISIPLLVFSYTPSLFASTPESTPRFSYQDALRETVFVKTPSSSTKIAVDLIRPKETNYGLMVPVILNASPYYEHMGRGNEHETKRYDKDGQIIKFPLFYDNYFVPRGYALVQVDMIGTNHSDGYPTIGGKEDIESVKTVVDWLNGRTNAWDKNGNEKKATWANGKVGMIGKSYDGALANGVASTGVDGLVTVVCIGAVNNWYDWFLYGGHSRANRRVDWFAETVASRRHAYTYSTIRDQLTKEAKKKTGNYNSFWEERNYLRNGNKIKASMFVIHGLNDFNVTMNHASSWWTILSENNIPRKLWLAQTGHVDPFDFRREKWVSTLHQWFDYWLLGLDNGIMNQPKVDIEREPDRWETQDDWPDPAATQVHFYLSPKEGKPGQLTTHPLNEHLMQSYTDDPYEVEEDRITDEDCLKEGRLLFISPFLPHTIRMSGTPKITIRAKVNKNDTHITVLLVDYGIDTRVDHEDPDEGIITLTEKECWGETAHNDNTYYYKTKKKLSTRDYEVVTRGWFNARHWKSLSETTYLTPYQWYTFHWDILPEDYIFKEGHRIGVILTGNDTIRIKEIMNRATVTVDFGNSVLTLPIVGGSDAIGF